MLLRFERFTQFLKSKPALWRMFLFCFGFLTGGTMYVLLEYSSRGYSHYSMFAAGGMCFVGLCKLCHTRFSFLVKCLIGSAMITLVELAVGSVVNLWLGMAVWDYTAEPFNFLGQICLRFSLIWCGLSAVVFAAHATAPRVQGFLRQAVIRDQNAEVE